MPLDDVFDLWDQAQITELTTRAVERVLGPDRERIASQFAPLTPTQADKIGVDRMKVAAVGKGRIIADDATPPIYRPKIKFVEEAWELVRLAEMTPVEESLRRQLENNGTDSDSVQRRQRAGADILTRARALQVRNENESDWMVMQAIVFGSLPVQVANPPNADTDTEYAIDYEFPSGHLAQVGTSFADLVNAAPITFMRSLQEKLKAATGKFGTDFWFSSQVWQYIINSTQVRNSFTWNAPANSTFIPTEEQIKQLLYDPQNVNFHVTDDGWYEEAAGYEILTDTTKTRWIPPDRMLCTVPSPVPGEPIAQMYDGMVPVQVDWDRYDYKGPGAQSYVQLLQGNLTLMWRQEARRIPMIHHPECITSAKVVL